MITLYEAKYSKYVIKNKSRFAYPQEIKDCCKHINKENHSACGTPLYYENGVMFVDDSDSHYYIQGKTGSKKSRTSGINIVNSIIASGENFLYNDPKGEVYEKTGQYAYSEGYNVLILNFRDFGNSCGWNPMSLAYNYYEKANMEKAEQTLNDFVDAVMGASKETAKDIYWTDCAALLLLGASLLLMDSVPKECFNMSNLIQLTHENDVGILREIISQVDPNTTVSNVLHSVLDLSAEKTISCIYSTLQQSLKPFIQNRELLNLLCKNDINFEDLITKKTAVYLIYPDEKTSLGFLMGLFFTQCYQYLVSFSSRFQGGFLPNRVNFILDEFSNLPAIENFENRISEARGHNIRYFLFGQSFGQLESKYNKNANTIIANCDWIIYPSKEIEFLERLARICGKEYDFYGNEHDLISPCDMQHLQKTQDGAEVLILKSGQYPFVTKLPDYEYIDIFPKLGYAQTKEIKSTSKPILFTMKEWVNGLGGIYKLPFFARQ